ncbi:MAG: hypothetical protein E7070_06235 [Bacteroidales bacterium]|nr:hypothetical protein [Bacteroidales bacterium]
MKLFGLTFQLLSLTCATASFADDQMRHDSISTRFDRFFADAPQEKIYIQTDRDRYEAGDTVWLRAHLADAVTLQPSTAPDYPATRSNFLYVELYDNAADTLVERIMIKRDSLGVFANAFFLPHELASGRYTMVAYTRWMMNFDQSLFARSEIHVAGAADAVLADATADNRLILALMPEGGQLIDGQRQTLAYKVTDAAGFGIDVDVRLMRATDRAVVQEGRSSHLGMGSLQLLADAADSLIVEANDSLGRTCYATVPRALAKGATLAVTQRKKNLYISPIVAGLDPSQLTLVAHGNGNLIVQDLRDGQPICIDTERLRPGVLNIALVEKNTLAVVAERLAFIYPRDTDGGIGITPKETSQHFVTLELSCNGGDIRPGTYAIAVTDADQSLRDSTSADIVSSLLLSQEIKGRIEDVGHYFRTSDERTRHDMNLLMMTQGWRRYALDDILHGQCPEIRHTMEATQSIEGKIGSTFQKHDAYNLHLLDPRSGSRTTLKVKGGNHFVIPDIDYPEGATLQMQVETEKGNGTFLQLDIAPQEFPQFTIGQNPQKYRPVALENDSSANGKIRYSSDFGTHHLPDFQVKAQKIKPMNRCGYLPDRFIAEDDPFLDQAKSLQVLVGKFGLSIGTIRVNRDDGITEFMQCINRVARMGGGQKPVCVVLNDQRIEEDEWDQVLSLDLTQIKQMEYFLPSSDSELESFAMLHLTKGKSDATGVLFIYTHQTYKHKATNRPLNFATVQQLGYRPPVEFYTPCESDNYNAADLDMRKTVYWNPRVRIGSDGKAQVRFYMPDAAKKLDIVLEGVSDEGRVISVSQRAE